METVNPNPLLLAGFTAALIAILTYSTIYRKTSKLPIVNGPTLFQVRLFKQLDFLKNGVEIFTQAKKDYPGQPFRMITELGEVVVLPPAFAHTFRNEEGLSFTKAIATASSNDTRKSALDDINQDFNGHIAGFEPIGLLDHDAQIAQAVARKQLTKTLNTITEPLSKEATFAIDLVFGDPSDWQEITIKPLLLDLVSRLSSRVFLGEEVCRNPEWLEITKNYTVDLVKASLKTMFLPPVIRSILSWFSQDYKLMRQELKEACKIINPVIERRMALKQQAQLEGKSVPKFNDAIEWAEEEAGGANYSAAVFQLLLSFLAIHTTTDLLCQTLLRLANEPELIIPLRKEIVCVLRAEGWSKNSLYNLKLMDSAIKEAQRIRSSSYLGMRRYAVKDIPFPEAGFTILKGERTMIDTTNMINPDIHVDPTKFDIYRFLNMREQPDQANKAQLVSTSPDQISFGHGKHACPGRFFAVNEIKIALCHLLLKYDWKLAVGTTLQPVVNGVMHRIDPESRLVIQRRKEEIKLETLSFS